METRSMWLVLMDELTFPGCLLECTLIGVIKAEQLGASGKLNRNDRLIAVAKQSLLYTDIHDIRDLNPTILKHIDAFFVNYQKLRDVKVAILAHHGPDQASKIVQDAAFEKYTA